MTIGREARLWQSLKIGTLFMRQARARLVRLTPYAVYVRRSHKMKQTQNTCARSLARGKAPAYSLARGEVAPWSLAQERRLQQSLWVVKNWT